MISGILLGLISAGALYAVIWCIRSSVQDRDKPMIVLWSTFGLGMVSVISLITIGVLFGKQ